MRSRLGLITVLVSLWVATAGAQDRRDGNWWIGQTPAVKIPYALGLIDGAEMWNPVVRAPADGRRWTPEEQARVKTLLQDFNEMRDKYLNGVTAGQIKDGLDSFYKDYRNRRISIVNATDLVLKSIAGEDIEKLTVALRQAAR